MGQVKEHYNAIPIAAATTIKVGVTLAGFIAAAATTITVTDADGTVLLNAVPCAAGIWTRIPLLFRTSAGGTVTLGAGAGTLFA